MPLTSGTRLGPYEIRRLVGSGGMGDVYEARDLRLGRTVALKLLREPNAGGRLAREARAIAALNHPHICTVHDVHVDEPPGYFVMEYIEGESLAERLTRGPVGLAEAIRLTAAIADALDAAHRAGIVHRDLKPANVMLTKTGVKVLDFGVAVHATAGDNDGGVTRTSAMLEAAGTPQYMAPEQLEGREVDGRADTWALGCVLHEMLSGCRAFDGTSVSAVIASVLTQEPSQLPRLSAELPVPLLHVLRVCLERNPDDRWQSARDLARELRWLNGEGVSRTDSSSVTGRSVSASRVAPVVVLLLLSLAAVAAFLIRGGRAAAPPAHVSIALPPDVQVNPTGGPYLSPDGRRLVVVGEKEGTRQLWLRELSQEAFVALEGTDGATFPFWAPDSDQLGFFADHKLKKLSLSRHSVQILCEANNPRGGAWGPDGTLVFNAVTTQGLSRVSSSGGTPTIVTRTAPGERSHRFPAFLPDGRHVLFSISTAVGSGGDVAIGSLGDGSYTRVLTDASDPAYSADGNLWFVRGRALFTQAIDVRALSLSGEPIKVVPRVGYVDAYQHADYSVAGDGTLGYMTTESALEVVSIARDGGTPQVLAEGAAGTVGGLWWASPDATRIAYWLPAGQTRFDLMIRDFRQGTQTRAIAGAELGACSAIAWGRRGDRIATITLDAGKRTVHVIALSGAGGDRAIPLPPGFFCAQSLTPDDRYLLALQGPDSASGGLAPSADERRQMKSVAIPIANAAPALDLASLPSGTINAVVSPDARWVVYTVQDGNRLEGYLQRFPPDGRAVKFTPDQVYMPTWRADGSELFFEDQTFTIKAVPLRAAANSALAVGAPAVVARSPVAKGLIAYGITPDGSRVLMEQTRATRGAGRGISLIMRRP